MTDNEYVKPLCYLRDSIITKKEWEWLTGHIPGYKPFYINKQNKRRQNKRNSTRVM